MPTSISLAQMGWNPFFQQQLSLDEWENLRIARISSVHRSLFNIVTQDGDALLSISCDTANLTVGDWLLVDKEGRFIRQLERSSCFSRKAAGSKIETQLIAANIDTVFIVCSLNDDFNLNRIERYLALAKNNTVEAVVILTKVDSCESPGTFVDQVQALDEFLHVIALNSLLSNSVALFSSYCKVGATVAFMGSSGVGKTTLANLLLGSNVLKTNAIREDDSKGRHTTTGRSLHIIATGGVLIDTPGMRELQLSDCEKGVEDVFNDIVMLSRQCRFSDCQHENEPGCAIVDALENGLIDERRLKNYHKLIREQAINSETMSERRDRQRSVTKFHRSVQSQARKNKKK